MPVLNLFERDLAVQLDVLGHEDLAESPVRMEPQDPEPRAAGPGRA